MYGLVEVFWVCQHQKEFLELSIGFMPFFLGVYGLVEVFWVCQHQKEFLELSIGSLDRLRLSVRVVALQAPRLSRLK